MKKILHVVNKATQLWCLFILAQDNLFVLGVVGGNTFSFWKHILESSLEHSQYFWTRANINDITLTENTQISDLGVTHIE